MEKLAQGFAKAVDGPFPPLPNPIPEPLPPHLLPQPGPLSPVVPHWPPWPPVHLRSLRGGCYILNYTPIGSPLVTYDGTMRVEVNAGGRTVSGDLYQRPTFVLPVPPIPKPPMRPWPVLPKIILAPPPNPAAGIPIFPRGRYRYYVCVNQVLEYFTLANSFTLGFDLYRWKTGAAPPAWDPPQSLTAQMAWVPAPAGYASDYLAGDVKNSAGAVVGKLSMGWVSPYLRKATVEIDRVAGREPLLDNGASVSWKTVGDQIGWDITVNDSEQSVAELSGDSWSDAECHAAMLAHRDASNLDAEWRYHVLAVKLLDSTPRGIMYDAYSTDSNNVPREGCAIATDWIIDPGWGAVSGMRFGSATKPYFRTVIHETGHAMGLYHNTADMGFMNTSDVIAASAPTTNPFPGNIQWSHAPDDQKRLRHIPDPYVRPGGVPFGTAYPTSIISPDDLVAEATGFKLEVSALLDTVPLGAPVRIGVTLKNVSGEPRFGSPDLGLGAGFVKGTVTDPSGAVRAFSPLVLCVDKEPLVAIDSGQAVSGWLTLLRGGQGALFPSPGTYTVEVEARWDVDGGDVAVAGRVAVLVSAAVDEAHARAALKVLSTPDVLPVTVLNGDHLVEGIDAIHVALANPILRPHYAHIEAKRLATRFKKRQPDIDKAADLLDATTVMSPAELTKAVRIVKANAGHGAAKRMQAVLKGKAARVPADGDVKAIVSAPISAIGLTP